jgi:glutamate racemase
MPSQTLSIGKMNTPTGPHILIVDSGVGALSLCDELFNKIPQCSISVIADNDGFPYGTKPEEFVAQRVLKLTTRFIQQRTVDLIIIGCNTASTTALPLLRENITLPIIGVVPAIKPAAVISKTKTIAVLATPATIDRNYTRQLASQYAQDCNVIYVGSEQLVKIAENKICGKPITIESARAELASLLNKYCDTAVLACTHFPLVKSELIQLAPNIKNWVDSSEAIARRAEYLLNINKPVHPGGQQSKKNRVVSVFFTKQAQSSYQPSFLNFLIEADHRHLLAP